MITTVVGGTAGCGGNRRPTYCCLLCAQQFSSEDKIRRNIEAINSNVTSAKLDDSGVGKNYGTAFVLENNNHGCTSVEHV